MVRTTISNRSSAKIQWREFHIDLEVLAQKTIFFKWPSGMLYMDVHLCVLLIVIEILRRKIQNAPSGSKRVGNT